VLISKKKRHRHAPSSTHALAAEKKYYRTAVVPTQKIVLHGWLATMPNNFSMCPRNAGKVVRAREHWEDSKKLFSE